MFAMAESAVSCRSAAILLATKSGHEVPLASAVNAITYGFIPADQKRFFKCLRAKMLNVLMDFLKAFVCIPVTQLIRSVSLVTTKATPLMKRREQMKAIQP